MDHTILLVEDQDDLRELLSEALELSGYGVLAARDGIEALDALATVPSVCMVLLDLLMPRMDGWEFYSHLRARPECVEVPVVVHSTTLAATAPPSVRFVRKPAELQRLLKIVREYCDAGRSEPLV